MSAPRPPRAGGRRLELHAHTHFSDGALSPQELVALARERGLAALAITDHDSVDGVAPAIAAAGEALEVVPGIEISSTLEQHDLHVLGYFIDWGARALTERLSVFREERRERTRAIVAKLETLGAGVAVEEVFAAAGPGVVGRPHIAQALVRAGHVPSIDAAFQKYLGSRGSAFVPRPAFASLDAVREIESAGGAAVLAHPGAVATRLVERLAQAEHLGWSAERFANGWTYAKERDNNLKRHNLLVNWSDLSPSDQEKDRSIVRSIPDVLEVAKWKAEPVSASV